MVSGQLLINRPAGLQRCFAKRNMAQPVILQYYDYDGQQIKPSSSIIDRHLQLTPAATTPLHVSFSAR